MLRRKGRKRNEDIGFQAPVMYCILDCGCDSEGVFV